MARARCRYASEAGHGEFGYIEKGPTALKQLVVTADDFGAAVEVNDAVLDAHRNGILTAASLMVAAPAAADAVARTRTTPSLRVGLHLVLVEGKPVLPASQVPDLVDADGNFRTDMARAGAAMFFLAHVKKQLAEEIAAQFAAFRATGLALDHVNAHKHFHLHPTIAGLMLSIGRDFGLKAARVPLEPVATLSQVEPCKRSAVAALTWPFAQGLRRRLARAGIASPDAVFGLAWSGAMTPKRLKGLIAHLPEGLSEIYLHPATGDYPGCAPGYRYAEERAALLDSSVIAAARSKNILLGGFQDFSHASR
jgi:hopanoid biosynthesis associated protein HpnK